MLADTMPSKLYLTYYSKRRIWICHFADEKTVTYYFCEMKERIKFLTKILLQEGKNIIYNIYTIYYDEHST